MNKNQENQLKKAQLVAESKNGKFISNEFTYVKAKYEWKCSNSEHPSWFAKFTSVVNGGNWCPHCATENNRQRLLVLKNKRTIKDGLKIAQEYAISRSGQCLSNEYINNRTKLDWKCHNPTHPIWKSPYSRVVTTKNWCKYCGYEANSIKNTLQNGLQKAQDYAISKGGICLSTEYISAKEAMHWKCENQEHHPWGAVFTNVVNGGSWCPQCASEKIIKNQMLVWQNKCISKINNLLDVAKEYATSKSGYCLSTKYMDATTKLEWKCHNSEHKSWFGNLDVVKRNSWCPQCSKEKTTKLLVENTENLKLKNGLQLAQDYASYKGGKCLSLIYINSISKMEWKCHNPKHTSWFSPYIAVVSGKAWCKKCGIEEMAKKQRIPNILNKAKEYAILKGVNVYLPNA